MSSPQINPISRIAAFAGEATASVSVRNLSCTTTGPHDAWGRPGRPQPLLVSVTVSFRTPFNTAAANDTVSSDTVHYGQMSKRIKLAVEAHGAQQGNITLKGLLGSIWADLTARNADGTPLTAEQVQRVHGPAIIDVRNTVALQLEVFLPKGSLLGEGVALKAAMGWTASGQPIMYGIALRLHRLRVPVLIGVNANEREAKQPVVADIEIENYVFVPDRYTALEKLVVAMLEKSSFETLEALAVQIASTIMTEFKDDGQKYEGNSGCQVRISLEKPLAVPFAEGPIIKIRAGAELNG